MLCAIAVRDGLPLEHGCERALWRLSDEPSLDPRPVELGPARLPLHVLVDPGLAADCAAGIARPFEDALGPARAWGYAVEVLPLGNLGGVGRNAELVTRYVERLPDDGSPVVLLGYSRGASDVMEALRGSAELRRRVSAFVAIAGTINGSPLAERSFSGLALLGRHLPGAECRLEDGRGVEDLRPPLRLAQRAAVPGVPAYSVVTFIDRAGVSPILAPAWDILAHIDARNDGQVLAWDQVVPGSMLLALLRADHLMPIAPAGPMLPWWARGLVNSEDFPRAAVLEAVLRVVEEDLLANGAVTTPQGDGLGQSAPLPAKPVDAER